MRSSDKHKVGPDTEAGGGGGGGGGGVQVRDDKDMDLPPKPKRPSLVSIDSEDENKMVEPEIDYLDISAQLYFHGKVKTGICGLDPTTGKGKQIHLIQMLLLPFVPIMALIIQNSINMVSILEYQNDMQETIDQVQISTGLGNVTEALQSERAEIAFYLFTNGSIIRRNLSEHFAYTNTLIENLKWPAFRIDDHSSRIKSCSGSDWMISETRLPGLTHPILKLVSPFITEPIISSLIRRRMPLVSGRPLLAYKNMIRAIEHLGISMVFGEQYFGRGDLDQSSYIAFVTNDALGQDFLNASQNFAFWIGTRYRALQNDYPWYSNITRRRLEILGREKIQPDFEKATEYFYAMLGYLDSLQKVQYEIRELEEPSYSYI
ncbi:hypothetical protein Pcinc_039472 [Petrolisthes cinctipes]|uniref:Uncharacterized protein n=1 Tax=Petrolisthes cinctipes TaxID=88211 RepID=A0AAE1BRK2_PETCI|nr:hypothetical protein Pcinc_039472 [Petrolisthes cinctipes]